MVWDMGLRAIPWDGMGPETSDPSHRGIIVVGDRMGYVGSHLLPDPIYVFPSEIESRL